MRKVIQKLKILNLRWKQVKKVYNDQPLGMTASGKIGGGYGFLLSMVSSGGIQVSLFTQLGSLVT